MHAQDWTVQDDARALQFRGFKLADVSSQRNKRGETKKRWIEIRIYRTIGGNFIVERVGVSTMKGEKDIHFAQVCETPRAVIETLYSKDGDGAWFLSWVARAALEEASKVDDSLEDEYRIEHID